MPLQDAVRQPLDLHARDHPGADFIGHRLVQERQDLHPGQVGEHEQVLLPPDRHPGLDPDHPRIVVPIDEEPVMGRADGAVFDLLLDFLETLLVNWTRLA